MVILREPVNVSEIRNLEGVQASFVKGVVDVNRGLIALDADMHYELADHLKEECGSEDIDLWGFNLWLDNPTLDAMLEFDSFINIHNNQLHGFLRGGMDIRPDDVRETAWEVIKKWIRL